MEEELKNIEQPVETQNLVSPERPIQDVHPVQDAGKRYPWYYVKRIDRYMRRHPSFGLEQLLKMDDYKGV